MIENKLLLFNNIKNSTFNIKISLWEKANKTYIITINSNVSSSNLYLINYREAVEKYDDLIFNLTKNFTQENLLNIETV